MQKMNDFLNREVEAFRTEVRITKRDLMFWKRLALTQLGVDSEKIEILLRDRGMEGLSASEMHIGGGVRKY